MLDFNPTIAPEPTPSPTASGISGLQQAPQDNNSLAKVTEKCAIAGVAIAGYAVAGWDQCECYTDTWTTVERSPYSITHEDC